MKLQGKNGLEYAPPAQLYFCHTRELALEEENLEDLIIKILGRDPEDIKTWGFDNIRFNEYDSSFSLEDCWLPLIKISKDQMEEFKDLGFNKCYLRYEDIDSGIYTETYEFNKENYK